MTQECGPPSRPGAAPVGRVKNWGILGWDWGCRRGSGPARGMRSETTIAHLG